jgi:hypothetical protein
MKHLFTKAYVIPFLSLVFLAAISMFVLADGVDAAAACDPLKYNEYAACSSIDTGSLGFQIPTLGDILTFAVRAFFAIAGLAALFYMLLGAFGWVTSGGDKDAITAAREKIQAAVVGMILVVAVLAVIWTLEQVIFKRRICLGLSCSVTLPGLIENVDTRVSCCACLESDGSLMTQSELNTNAPAGGWPVGTSNVKDLFDTTQICAEY